MCHLLPEQCLSLEDIEDICLSEELIAIREFTTQAAPARIAQFIETHLPSELRSNQEQVQLFTQAAVRDVFDMLLESWDSSQPGQSSGCDQSSIVDTPHRTHGSNRDSGYSSSETPSAESRSSDRSLFNDENVRNSAVDPLPSSQFLSDELGYGQVPELPEFDFGPLFSPTG